MKNIILLITICSIPVFVFGQTCNSATIYATTGSNASCFEVVSNVRYCYSNNYPNHSDNYNQPQFTLTEDDGAFNMCAYPDTNSWFTPLYEETETSVGCTDIYMFGVLLNGVHLDPSSGDYFVKDDGSNNIEWHVEATSTTNTIGQNMGTLNGGHLNPKGFYHYHGVPTDYFVNDLSIDGSEHSPIVGYAADGFPIYYKYVFHNANDTASPVVSLSSGYSLKSGSRSGDGLSAPDGSYDGEYYEDYKYTTTTLDSCNGRYAKTPDYPNGTYYYVLTDNYPFIPRCFKGTELDPTYRVGPDAACPASSASSNCAASVPGCMDPFADNYNANANNDDGSCTYTLPVELLHFSGIRVGEHILLKWQTAMELNNSHFEIEASLDGISFIKIGEVKGAGTTTETQFYEFLDNRRDVAPQSFYQNRNQYYRLKQYDLPNGQAGFDGNFEYSNIIQIDIASVATPMVKIYPNPTNGFLTLETTAQTNIFISNIFGQEVLTKSITGKQQLDISHLAKGIYFISNGQHTQKLIIE